MFNLFNTLINDQIPLQTNDFPIRVGCTWCLVVVGKISMRKQNKTQTKMLNLLNITC